MICVSIVTHGHGRMVQLLVELLMRCEQVSQIIVTKNIPEELDLPTDSRVVVRNNLYVKGFGANHNAAFLRCNQQWFCVLNPDILLNENPFGSLVEYADMHSVSLVAPGVVAVDGRVEDSIRRFPTIWALVLKGIGLDDGRWDSGGANEVIFPDWVAGMFMLVRTSDFEKVGGFDESFFLYYEDVDLCARIWRAGLRVAAVPNVHVIHDARRESHRSLRFMTWHLASVMRYFWKHLGRLPTSVLRG